MLRKFHIDLFPQDRIFVLLNKDYHKKLFGFIKINYKFKEFNKKFFDDKLNNHTYKGWKSRRIKKTGWKQPRFIPLWFILKIPKIFSNNFAFEELEKNIIAYRGPSSSSIIWNPNLPLIEDGRLLKIIAHLLGDGHAGGGFGTGLPKGKAHSDYRNYNNHLLDQFEKDIQVFGKVHTSKDYNHHHVMFSNLIGYILQYIYKIKFDCHNSSVPVDLCNLDREIISKFIRAFADDESHVYDCHIDFYSTNKRLLLGIMNLLKLKFPELKISKIKVSKRRIEHHHDKYYFYVLNNSIKNYYELIGFDHPQKKEDLIYNIKRISNRKGCNIYIRNSKKIILNFLKYENLSAKEISRKLNVAHCTALWHINKLKEDNKVKIIDRGHFAENVWGLV